MHSAADDAAAVRPLTTTSVSQSSWGWSQWFVLLQCGLGYMGVCSELLVFTFMQAGVAETFDLHAYAYPLLPVATTLTSVVAGLLWGAAADRFGLGRQRVFLLASLVTAIGSVASAFATSFPMLVVLRCVATVGGTGLSVVLFVLMAEFAPPSVRGRALVSLTAFGTFGVLYIAAVAWILARVDSPTGTMDGFDVWRWIAGLAAAPVVVALLFRVAVGTLERPDHTRGGAVQKAHTAADPEARLSSLRAPVMAERSGDGRVGEGPVRGSGGWASARELVRLMVGPTLRQRTVLLAVAWLCTEAAYWGTTMYLPTYLHSVGVDPYAVTFTMVAAEVPGLAVTFMVVERKGWGRLLSLRTQLLCAAVATGVLALGAWKGVASTVLIIAASLCQYCTLIPAFAVLFAVTPELYPGNIRSSVMGVFNIVSSVPPLYTPFLSKYLVSDVMGSWLYPLVWSGFLSLAALAVWNIPLELEPRGTVLSHAHDTDAPYAALHNTQGSSATPSKK